MPGLFSVAELVKATAGREENITTDCVNSISIDTRTLDKGALFVAIKGEQFDGHDFVNKAMANKACLALVSEARAPQFAGLPLIIVPDSLVALNKIARAARARCPAKIVAVTGSAGKTTSKEILRTILMRVGKTHASIKSYNNHWGVPLMLAGMPGNTKFGVFEIGMNHRDEITPLVKMVKPHIALITNIGPAHIGYLGSIEEIARAKAEIFSGIEPGGIAVVNIDHEQVDILQDVAAERVDIKLITYGYSESADVHMSPPITSQNSCVSEVTMENKNFQVRLNVSGSHMMANAVGALCVATQLGVPVDVTLKALSEFEAAEGRGIIRRLGSEDNPLVLMDESYNANPASMVAALEVFSLQSAPKGRKILVLGDMLELGASADKYHGELSRPIALSGADLVFLVGPYMHQQKSAFSGEVEIAGAAKELSEINETILNSLDYGDTIMVKGSKGIGLGQLVAAIGEQFAGGE